MNTKPILMSGEMVLALLAGRKWQTRRAIKPQPEFRGSGDSWYWAGGSRLVKAGYGAPYVHTDRCAMIRAMERACSYGSAGDYLWVKETFQLWDNSIDTIEVAYRAGWPEASKIIETRDKPKGLHRRKLDHTKPWTPSIFMPRWASRITLEIVSVRPERLQDITEEDAEDEGIEGRWHPEDPKLWTWKDYRRSKRFKKPIFHYGSAVTRVSTYAGLWESINGDGSWDKNPWVWRIEFKRV